MGARRLSVFLACLAVGLVGACSQQPSPSFTLRLDESSLTIDQGAAGVVAVAVECDSGFAGAVTLALEAPPAGVTGTFAPDALIRSGSSTLTLEVGLTAQAGTYSMAVLGTSGNAAAQAELTLTVVRVPTDFAVSLAPASLSVEQSLAATVDVTIVRSSSFPDVVLLTLEDRPAGVTGSFLPNPVTGSASSLSLQIGSGVAVGVHPLTVKATAGAVTHSADLALAVTERGFGLAGIPDEVAVTPPTIRVLPFTIDRTASFTDAITLALDGAPAGVSSSFVPNPSTTTGSTLTLSVADTVSDGTYGLTVKAASATGHTDTRTLLLVVTPRSEDGFDLVLEPTSLTLKQGQQADVAITVERTAGFAEPVSLSAVVDPGAQHIRVTFDPALAADSSIMTVAIGINVPPRTYQLVVQGLSDRLGGSASLSLLVTGDD
jgi:trimeric autotransporter adhesin